MNFRKITALCIALTACASLFSGCGDDDDSGSKKSSKKASKSSVVAEEDTTSGGEEMTDEDTTADNGEEPTEAEPEPTEEETEAPTEAPTETSNQENAMSLINKEWENGNVSVYSSVQNFNPFNYDGKIYVIGESFGIKAPAGFYDINKKEFTTVDDFNVMCEGKFNSCRVFCNGNFYVVYGDNNMNYTLVKYDAELNKLGEYAFKNGVKYEAAGMVATNSGAVVLSNQSGKYVLSPDLKTLTELPTPQITAEHGIVKDAENYAPIGVDGTKVYFYISDNDTITCVDTDDLDTGWSEPFECEFKVGHISDNPEYIYGKYYLYSDDVYDATTGKCVAKDFNKEQYALGSDRFIESNINTNSWYVSAEKIVSIDENTTKLGEDDFSSRVTIKKVDGEYYLFVDGDGIFLRTYAKGKDEEETIVLFEKN